MLSLAATMVRARQASFVGATVAIALGSASSARAVS
jgi:hypothetical protein